MQGFNVREVGRGVVTLLLLGAVALVSACGGNSPAPGTDRTEPVSVTTKMCADIAAVRPAPETPTAELVVDRTRSGDLGAFPPAVTEALTADQKAGWNLEVVSVNGSSGKPRLSQVVALDPQHDVESVVADNERTAALACVSRLADSADLAPTAPGSDQLAALAAAGRQRPAQILVVSDGISTGALDIATIGFDANPASVAADLDKAGDLFDLGGIPLIWTGLGDTATPLPQPARSGLQAIWSAVLLRLHTRANFDTRTSPARSGSGARIVASSTVADPSPVLTVPPVQRGSITCLTLPSGLLFAPESAVLGNPEPLHAVADALTAHPSWVAHVVGHTADFGPVIGQQRLSEIRASAVAAAIRQIGPKNPITASGVGSREPAVPEWHDGEHDLAAAARNRRVVVSYGDAAALAGGGCP